MGRLGAQPVAVGKAEKPAQAQVSVGGDGAFAGHDVADALRKGCNKDSSTDHGNEYSGRTLLGPKDRILDLPSRLAANPRYSCNNPEAEILFDLQ